MLKLFTLALIVLGAALLYLSNRHQVVLYRPLSQAVRPGAYMALGLALFVPVLEWDGAVALFFWVFAAGTALCVIPLLSSAISRRS